MRLSRHCWSRNWSRTWIVSFPFTLNVLFDSKDYSYHEQARFDRDSFVRILTQNIQSGLESQFTKQNPNTMTTFGVQYDYGSVMHYDAYSFSRNNQPTIQTNDLNYQDTIGQRTGLSFNDVKKINFAYCNSKFGANAAK